MTEANALVKQTAPVERYAGLPPRHRVWRAAGRSARLTAALLCLTPAVAGAADPAPVTLRFLPAASPDAPPSLLVSFGGAPRRVTMDTGSTGLVISASALPPLNRLRDLGPGRLTYSSSGRIMEGRWVEIVLTIAGDGDAALTTRPMPVLAVTRIRCLHTARTCRPDNQPTHVAMLGVGFARERDHQPDGTPDHNPFLNSAAAVGTPGYIVRRDGVQIGLAPTDPPGFHLIRLARDAAGTDWAAPPVCITVADTTPACGTILVDTGVASMFLTVPPDVLGGTEAGLPTGTRLAFDLTGGSRSGPAYSIVVGDRTTPLAPTAITLVGVGRKPTFVNTGLHFLNGFDILFDAAAGRFGYRTRSPG